MMSSILIRINNSVNKNGFLGFILIAFNRISQKFKPIIISPLSIPIAFILCIISPWIPIRIIRLYSDRIGHYALNTEVILCILDVYKTNGRRKKTFFYTIPNGSICNTQLHKMWKRSIHILPFPYLINEINKYLMLWNADYRNDEIKHYFELLDGFDQWNLFRKIKNCHTYFTESELKKGKKLLDKLGIPPDAKYVCLLARDANYLNVYKPNSNTSHHDFRNIDINLYKEPAKYLTKQGYYVVRMGKYVQDPFNVDDPKIIDYAISEFRSDFLDIYLSANCHFFMSVGTGLDSVAQIFRVPLLITNFSLADRGIWPDWTLCIPKKLYSNAEKRFLTFKETYDLFYPDQTLIMKIINDKNLTIVPNTSDEIIDIIKEMIDFMNNNCCYDSADQQLQKQFWSDFPNRFSKNIVLGMDVFKYGNLSDHVRIGRKYLKKNNELLH